MLPNGVKWFQMCPNVSKLRQMSTTCGTCLQISSNVSNYLISVKTYNKLTFLSWHIFNVTLCVWGLFLLRIREIFNFTISVLVPFSLVCWTQQLLHVQPQVNVTIWFGGCFDCDLEQTNSFTVSHQFNVTIWFWGCFDCNLEQNLSHTFNQHFNVTICFW